MEKRAEEARLDEAFVLLADLRCHTGRASAVWREGMSLAILTHTHNVTASSPHSLFLHAVIALILRNLTPHSFIHSQLHSISLLQPHSLTPFSASLPYGISSQHHPFKALPLICSFSQPYFFKAAFSFSLTPSPSQFHSLASSLLHAFTAPQILTPTQLHNPASSAPHSLTSHSHTVPAATVRSAVARLAG